MNVQYISDNDTSVVFVIEGVRAPFVNALRRVLMSEIPVYACKDLIVYDNSSPLFDEIISHRIGLVPLTTPKDADESSRMVTISVEATGPAVVTSASFVSDDPEVAPTSEDFPIVKLGEGQRLMCNAECVVGYGKDHVRWQPGLASYKNYPLITVNHETCNRCKSCIKACPRSILSIEDDAVVVTDPTLCTFCRSCEEACIKSNEESLITVMPSEESFIFKLESYGNMPAKDLLSAAFMVIDSKVKGLDQALSGL
jgi:DNA-directed RNA polymerase subunit D